jgi:predicted sulfurtransferase
MLCWSVRQRDAKALLNHEYRCVEELSVMTTEEMVAAAKAVVPAVTVQEVQAKLQAGERVVVLDVREKEEYDQGHIPQATLLPRGLLEFRYRDILPDLTTNIILH